MMYNGLSLKQIQILNYIKSEISKKGYPPTFRDIGRGVNLKSTCSVSSHLKTLEKMGYIARDPSKPRAIKLSDKAFEPICETIDIPIVKQIGKEIPLLAVENITGYFPIPAEYLPNEETFILNVKGESMVNAGINNGDQIIVAKRNTAKNGDIVVVLVNDSATVKRFFKEDNHIRLQPENDTMKPIIIDNCEIVGKVIGLIRLNIN